MIAYRGKSSWWYLPLHIIFIWDYEFKHETNTCNPINSNSIISQQISFKFIFVWAVRLCTSCYVATRYNLKVNKYTLTLTFNAQNYFGSYVYTSDSWSYCRRIQISKVELGHSRANAAFFQVMLLRRTQYTLFLIEVSHESAPRERYTSYVISTAKLLKTGPRVVMMQLLFSDDDAPCMPFHTAVPSVCLFLFSCACVGVYKP